MKPIALISLLLLLSLTNAYSADIKLASPKSVGMSNQGISKINQLAQRYIDKGQYSGIVTMVSRKGKTIHLAAHGTMGADSDTALETDSLFRIYSMTKPITAIAAMMLYEEGKFHLNDPVSKYLPEFADQKLLRDGELVAPKSAMTMRQLFTHTAGLTYGFTADNPVDIAYQKAKLFESENLDEFVSNVAKLPLRFEPGTRYHYSVSMDILGAVIEKLSGMPLDKFYYSRIFEPLGMQDTFFQLPKDKQGRLVHDQFWDAQNNKVGSMPAAGSRDYTNVTLFMGGGGLISTASDYMRFAQMILNGGSYNGVRLLGPKTVEYLSSNHLSDKVRAEGVGLYPSADLYAGQSMALGMGVVTNSALMPSTSSIGELSWSGLAGTKFWIDPKEELIGIALVQLYSAPWPLRFDLKVAAYQALDKLNN